MRGLIMSFTGAMPSVKCSVVSQGVLIDKDARFRLCIVF